MLDLISIVAALTYLALLGFGFYYARGSAPLNDLATALNLYLLAALVEFVALCANIADTADDGWLSVGISAFNFAVSIAFTWFTARRMDRADRGAR